MKAPPTGQSVLLENGIIVPRRSCDPGERMSGSLRRTRVFKRLFPEDYLSETGFSGGGKGFLIRTLLV